MLNKLRNFDWSLVVIPLLLILIGIAVIYTVTFPNVGFALARSQIVYAVLGIIAAVAFTLIDYRNWESFAYFTYAFGILLLILVIFIGTEQFGAKSWIDLGSFSLQPSELFKLFLVLILARLFSAWAGAFTVARFVTTLVIMMIPTIMVFRQPDFGTASVLFAISFGMLFFAKLPWKAWAALVAIAVVLLPIGYVTLKPYQKARINTFLHPEEDQQGSGYNVQQAMIAIGSGGLTGQGLGKGSQSQLNFLPVAHTDFIFAGLAEATGLVGALVLLGLYFFLIARVFRVAELAKDSYGMYVAVGIAIMLIYQVVINIGMNIGLLPVTGITLPLVSSGGTSLIVTMACIGVLQSIYIRHKKITF
jgi:rod shape determining protein RodA